MAEGLFGGFAEGLIQGRTLGQRQQQLDQNYDLGVRGLQIQQQAQDNAQKRFDTARHDKIADEAMKTIMSSVQQMKKSGASDATIRKAFGPALDTMRQNAKLRGLDPSEAVDVSFNSVMSTPSFNIASLVESASTQYDVPQNELHNAIQTESGGNPNAVNPKSGASGIAQFTPGTAASRGVNAANPNSAVPGMASYVSDMTKQFGGNRGLAWAGYNWGPGNVQKWIQNGADIKQVPKETQNYVLSVTGKPLEEWVGQGQVQTQPQGQTQQQQLTTLYSALNNPNVDPNIKKVLGTRLNNIVNPGSEVQVKVVKDENQNDHVVFVDPTKRTVTDQNGNPYVPPSGEDSDAGAIATAIKEGKQPPVLTGLYKNAKAVRAQLARDGVDLTSMQLEWNAATKQIQSLNGPQMVRYSGLATSVVNTIDEVKSLSQQLANSGVPLLNAAKLQTYIQTAGNSPNGQLATRYLAAVNTLKEEFANLAQGGYAPIEAAWALANQQINGNYGVKQLEASLGEVQRLIRYRLNGIPNFTKLGPPGNNRYVGSSNDAQPHGAPAPAPQQPVDWQTYFGK